MSDRKYLPPLLIIVVLILAVGSTYYFTTNQYKPVILELEENLGTSNSLNEQLNSNLERTKIISANQNSSIIELSQIISSLQSEVSEIEDAIISLTQVFNEKSQDLIKYKNITREFYRVNPIRIGFTASSDYDVSFIEDLAEKVEIDIHKYCTKNDLPYRFEFVIGNNLGLDDMAITNTLTYDTLGINLVVGHGVDSQCSSSLNYVNDNDMLLLSYGSSSNLLAIKDNLYRLTPNETVQFQANIACMKELEIEHVVLFTERSDWGDSLSQLMVDKLEENDIEVSFLKFSNNPIVSLTPKLMELSDLLYNMTAKYGKDHVAVQLVGDSRIQDIGVGSGARVWFGLENSIYADFTGIDVGRKLILCPVPVSLTKNYNDFRNEIEENYEFEVSYYGASAYDACWLYALSIMESGNTDIESIKDSLDIISNSYVGVSGDCSLNNFGDKITSDYRIMGFVGDGEFLEFGTYHYANQTVEFTRIHPELPS